MVSLLAVGFWLTAVLLVHVYFLYPGVLFVLGAIIDRSEPYELPEDLPTVSLVIAAYNEEEIIAEKIENSLELDYPREKLEIIVFSDASSDDTDRIVESYADQGVRLERIEGRVGKTECQNRVTERVNADIVVFSDADSMYEPQAIKRLVGTFGTTWAVWSGNCATGSTVSRPSQRTERSRSASGAGNRESAPAPARTARSTPSSARRTSRCHRITSVTSPNRSRSSNRAIASSTRRMRARGRTPVTTSNRGSREFS